MTWKDITYRQFMRIKEITENETLNEEEQMLELVLLLFGDVPISEMHKYSVEVYKLLEEPFPEGDTTRKELEVHNRKYTVTTDLGKITTSQFIDYSNYVKAKADLVDILSCFIIPKGHKYDDGYDMDEVKEDIRDFSISTVQSYCFFFRKKWMKLQRLSLLYLMSETLKLKGMPMKNKLKMVWAQAALWKNMDYLTTSLRW